MIKLRASALIYAVVFSIAILIITVFLVSSLYDSQISFILLKRMERANDNMQSALALLQYSASFDPENPPATLDLFNDGEDLAKIKKEQWGLWDVYTVTTQVGNKRLQKSFLMGYKPDLSYALAITGTDRPFNVAGFTKITGNAYVPNGMFKRSYIEKRLGSVPDVVNGQLQSTGAYASRQKETVVNKIEQFKAIAKNFAVNGGNLQMHEKPFNSFANTPDIIFSEQAIKLSGVELNGKFVVCSQSRIEVTSTCKLQDVILIAPEIIIENRVEGIVQCFSERKLQVGNDVHLKYPSALVMHQPHNADSAARLSVGEHSTVAGIIVASSEKGSKHKPLLDLGLRTRVYGQVFCDGYTQLRSIIYGNIETGSFFLRTPSAAYDNTLMDAEINSVKLMPQFYSAVGLPQNRRIVKWLY